MLERTRLLIINDSGLIPTRLKAEMPIRVYRLTYTLYLRAKPVPGGFARLDNVLVAVPNQGTEVVLAQIVPDVPMGFNSGLYGGRSTRLGTN